MWLLLFKVADKSSFLMAILLFLVLAVTVVLSNISANGFATTSFLSSQSSSLGQSQNKEQITINAIFVEPKDRWDMLVKNALDELRQRHPQVDIRINYTVLPYNISREQMLKALSSNESDIDLVSVDQIWLGEFAQRGLLTDLSDRAEKWGRLSDWYEANLDGNLYGDRIYGIWAWTDVRSIWYWKDLLQEAGVHPESLKTWNGYIMSAKKLNEVLRPQGIEGTELICGNNSANMWYPFLWMIGGEILRFKEEHPTKGNYFFPDYNSSEGVEALQFLKDQADVGIKPKTTDFGKDFVNRKVALMPAGSWLPADFPRTENDTSPKEEEKNLEEKVGTVPYPVPNNETETSTLLGGWLLSIPQISKNKELVWELVTIMLEPNILAPVLAEYKYLPTQIPLGEGPYASQLNQTIVYYDKLTSLIPLGHERPNIPEFPQIDEHISQAIDEVCHKVRDPTQALANAATKSAKVLGW